MTKDELRRWFIAAGIPPGKAAIAARLAGPAVVQRIARIEAMSDSEIFDAIRADAPATWADADVEADCGGGAR